MKFRSARTRPQAFACPLRNVSIAPIDHVRIDHQPRNECRLADAQTLGMHDRQIIGGIERHDGVIARPGIVQSLANLFVALGIILAVLRRELGADAVNSPRRRRGCRRRDRVATCVFRHSNRRSPATQALTIRAVDGSRPVVSRSNAQIGRSDQLLIGGLSVQNVMSESLCTPLPTQTTNSHLRGEGGGGCCVTV